MNNHKVPGPEPKAHPDPEVVAQAKRRRFTAEYKHRIVSEAEQAKGSGQIGALLRREGLYSSTLTAWRRERASVVRQALTPQKRGPKSKRDPVQEEVQKLQKENARLTEELRKAALIIDVQKNWARCWAGRCRPKKRSTSSYECRRSTRSHHRH